MKLYPSCAGTHPTLDALLDLRAARRFTADDVERDRDRRRLHHADDPDLRPARERARGEVQHAVLRGGGDRVRPRRHRHVRRRAASRPARSSRCMPRVTMRVDPDARRGAPPLTQARVTRASARRPHADAATPTARAAIPSARRAMPSSTRSSWRARRARCRRRRPREALERLRGTSTTSRRTLTDADCRRRDVRLKAIRSERALRGSLRARRRHVPALPDHERPRELDDGRAVLVHAGRLDADDADVRA